MDWQLDYRLTNSVLHRVEFMPLLWMDGWMYVCTAHIIPPSKVPVAAWPMQHQNVSSLQRITWEIRNTRFNLNVLSLHCQMCGPCFTFSNRVASSSRSSGSMSVLEFIFAVCEGAGISLFAERCGLNIGTLVWFERKAEIGWNNADLVYLGKIKMSNSLHPYMCDFILISACLPIFSLSTHSVHVATYRFIRLIY